MFLAVCYANRNITVTNTHFLKKQNLISLRMAKPLVVIIVYHPFASPISRYFVADFHCVFDPKLSVSINSKQLVNFFTNQCS